jgi:hypothetical protein
MARLAQSSHLTPGFAPDVAKIIQQTHAGQAHFANGPLGATCNDCIFYGAWKRIKSASDEIVSTTRVNGACDKYRQLMGKLGPAVPSNASACKYFERKEVGHQEGDRDL